MKLALPDLISNSYFPAIAAVELGLFRREGLDVSLELLSPADKAYGALARGDVSFVAAEAHAGLTAFPRWSGMKFLCALGQGMYWFLVLRADVDAGRGDLRALRGARIGAAPWVELGLKQLLADGGIDVVRDEIRIAPIPGSLGLKINTGVTAAKALEDGLVDGFFANGMGAEIAVRSGVGKILLDIRRGDGPRGCFDYTFAGLAATTEFIERNREAAAAAIRAIVGAQAALKEDVALAGAVGRRLFPPDEAELIVELVRRDLPFYDARIARNTVAGLSRFSRQVGLLAGEPDYEDIVATQFCRLWTPEALA